MSFPPPPKNKKSHTHTCACTHAHVHTYTPTIPCKYLSTQRLFNSTLASNFTADSFSTFNNYESKPERLSNLPNYSWSLYCLVNLCLNSPYPSSSDLQTSQLVLFLLWSKLIAIPNSYLLVLGRPGASVYKCIPLFQMRDFEYLKLTPGTWSFASCG